MNKSNDTRDRRDELGVFCYYKVLALPEKQYSVIWKWTWIICKCIERTLGQPIRKVKRKNIIDMPKKERKCNHIKCSGKATNGRKWMGEKIGKRTTLSIIIKMSTPNAPVKRQRLSELIKKKKKRTKSPNKKLTIWIVLYLLKKLNQ